ncbi:hypothetical protein J4227_04960 [Candidatus Woesearchaeota archaeon]|nr:hypothetical protein [Candidatus Woesearchaeota archaeon]
MVKFPDSVDDLIYFTRRAVGDGKVVCWVYKQKCPKCKKELMGKPRDESGKVRIRAKEYTCPACKYTLEKKEYEESLTAEAQYTCPECKKPGEAEAQFKRKKIEGVETLRFRCGHCSANIDVTKKMKEKGAKDDGDDD